MSLVVAGRNPGFFDSLQTLCSSSTTTIRYFATAHSAYRFREPIFALYQGSALAVP